MSDETIGPALTPEEWAHALRSDIPLALEPVASTPEGCHVVMAINNAALPDGDPRKLTREDVALLRELARLAKSLEYEKGDDATGDEWLTRGNALADKIVALLPPEGTHGE